MKKLRLWCLATLLTATMCGTAFAGEWFKDNGKWAYKDDNGVQIKEGWFTDTDGRVYNFNGGVTRTGLYTENGVTYYFNPTSGERCSGLVTDGDKSYFLNIGGVLQTGWFIYNGSWYCADNDGNVYKDKLVEINGNKYYFHADGRMAVKEWVKDSTYYASENGTIATAQWVDGTYVNSSGKATDSESKSSTGKKKIDNKTFTLEEYKELAQDAQERYLSDTETIAEKIMEWREEYNEDRVYNYSGDDDDYIERNELPTWDVDSTLSYAASIRAVELASAQRASGARPDGRNMSTIFTDIGSEYTASYESVAFGYDDGEDCFDALESNSTHTSNWKQKSINRIGVGAACDSSGRMYYVVFYAE